MRSSLQSLNHSLCKLKFQSINLLFFNANILWDVAGLPTLRPTDGACCPPPKIQEFNNMKAALKTQKLAVVSKDVLGADFSSVKFHF